MTQQWRQAGIFKKMVMTSGVSRLKVILFWGVLILLVILVLRQLEQWYSLAQLQQWAVEKPYFSSALYAAILVFIAVFCLPGSGPLTVLAGAIFGFWWGALLVSFASALGATLAMLMTREWLQHWVRAKFQGMAENILIRLDRDGVWYLFSIRLMPAIPFFLVNLVFGLTNIPALRFYVVTQLGMLAGVVIYVNAGTQLQNLSLAHWTVALNTNLVLSLALLAFFPWLLRNILSRMKLITLEKND